MDRILYPAFNEFTSGCKGRENLPVNQMVANVQRNLQTTDFQSVKNQSAPRSKFVKVVLRASVSMVSVPYSFGRSVEMTGKRDSFGRSA